MHLSFRNRGALVGTDIGTDTQTHIVNVYGRLNFRSNGFKIAQLNKITTELKLLYGSLSNTHCT